MDIYPDNSGMGKQQPATGNAEPKPCEKRFDKVISGGVKIQRKSVFKKFLSLFTPEDLAKVGETILTDTIVPNLKRAFVDIVNNAAYTFAYGEMPASKPGLPGTRVSYDRCYGSPQQSGTKIFTPQKSYQSNDYEDVLFETRGEAEMILANMRDALKMYEIITVLDYYDMIGITSKPTDAKRGWINLDNAFVSGAPGGFKIHLPKAMPID